MNPDENFIDLNNFGHRELSEDFADSPFADREEEPVEPDTNDPSLFPAEGSDIE